MKEILFYLYEHEYLIMNYFYRFSPFSPFSRLQSHGLYASITTTTTTQTFRELLTTQKMIQQIMNS